jgi:ABC-type lipoprotein export system ATPase subunit
MSEAKPVVELRDVAKHYGKGGQVVHALDGIDLQVRDGGMVAFVGPSGSGKSTLLHLIGGMDRPTRGTVTVAGRNLGDLARRDLTRFRCDTVGFVFQSFNLIPNLTAEENVLLPMEFAKAPKAEARRRAQALLEGVGLTPRMHHRPGELSGGEQQRVAIARALANNPPLVLADEPTGNLDSETGQAIYALLHEIARERTVLVVTHAEAFARMADRVLHLRDGRLQDVPAGSSSAS